MNRRELSVLTVAVILIAAHALKGQEGEDPQARKRSFEDGFIEPPSANVAALADDVAKRAERRKQLSERLQKIALDQKRKRVDRHAAIDALGKLRDEESLDFLAQHIGLGLAPDLVGTRAQQLRKWPCRHALGAAGWSSIPAILRRLETERSEIELIWSGSLLSRYPPGKEVALALLKVELRRAKSEIHRRNLERMLEIVASNS